MIVRKSIPHSPKALPRTKVGPAIYPCKCSGCLNKVPFKRFTCKECFIWCDQRSHRVRLSCPKRSRR